mmetsp:Transcript_24239/g.77804  ORF Transcript_24239/g.77804 Transcript_24239/m.77804 type:complete len:294 (+) Transcript_24239:893-1774(+)
MVQLAGDVPVPLQVVRLVHGGKAARRDELEDDEAPVGGAAAAGGALLPRFVDLPPVPREGGAIAHFGGQAVGFLREAQLRHVRLHATLERLSLFLSLLLLSREQNLAQLQRLLQIQQLQRLLLPAAAAPPLAALPPPPAHNARRGPLRAREEISLPYVRPSPAGPSSAGLDLPAAGGRRTLRRWAAATAARSITPTTALRAGTLGPMLLLLLCLSSSKICFGGAGRVALLIGVPALRLLLLHSGAAPTLASTPPASATFCSSPSCCAPSSTAASSTPPKCSTSASRRPSSAWT